MEAIVAIVLIALLGGVAIVCMALSFDRFIDDYPTVSGADIYRIPYSERRRVHNRLTRLKRRRRALLTKQLKASSLAREFDAVGLYDRVAMLVAESDDAKRRGDLLDQKIEQVEKEKDEEKRERDYRALARRREDDYNKLTKEK